MKIRSGQGLLSPHIFPKKKCGNIALILILPCLTALSMRSERNIASSDLWEKSSAVVNDNLELAFAQLQSIANAEKHRTTRFHPHISEN